MGNKKVKGLASRQRKRQKQAEREATVKEQLDGNRHVDRTELNPSSAKFVNLKNLGYRANCPV